MPKGPTDTIQKAKQTFQDLKKESLIKGKNMATIAKIAKQSKTSRNNFYTKKSQGWEELVEDINDFAVEFNNLAKGKHKNPEVEAFKKLAKEWETKYKEMTKQNTEFLSIFDDKDRIISDKQQTIKLLEQQLKDSNYE